MNAICGVERNKFCMGIERNACHMGCCEELMPYMVLRGNNAIWGADNVI